MFCSRQAQPPHTQIPSALRDTIGALLQGPPGSAHRQSRPVCVFALGRLGDFVLTLSVIRTLAREFGTDACTLVVPGPLASVASRELPGVRQITLPTEAASLFREILPIWRHERRKFAADHFGRLICLSHQRSLYYELALSWIDAGQDLRLTPETYPQEPADGLCTELLAHGRLAGVALGRDLTRDELLPRLSSPAVREDGHLLVCPFSRDPVRNLPADTLLRTLQLWRQHHRAPLVFGGNQSDRPALERLAAGFSDAHVETPDGIDGLIEQIARAGAVFAADSAPAHLATALDKRAVVMTSRSFHGYAQPWTRSDRQQIFVHGTPAEQVAAALPNP